MRKLGEVQQITIESLVKYGFWPSGFLYANYSSTAKIMDSLVARGMAEKKSNGKYYPTDAGRLAAQSKLDRIIKAQS